jgi:hypothetical protein
MTSLPFKSSKTFDHNSVGLAYLQSSGPGSSVGIATGYGMDGPET